MSGPVLLGAASAEQRQRRLAGGLRSMGLRPGDRVLVSASLDADRLLVVLAALRTGIVPLVLHSGLLEHERQRLVDDAEVALVVDDVVVADLDAAAPTEVAPWPLARPMHYTSGTTGVPKGVFSGVLSETEAAALFAAEADLWSFAPTDRHLVCSPLHHSVSIRFAGHTLLRGGEVVLPGPFDARRVAALLARAEVTTTFMAPAHLQRLAEVWSGGAPDTLRLLAHAGSPCPEGLKRWAIDGFGAPVVWEFYGSTEGQFTVCSAPEWLERPGTVGRSRPDRRVTVDEEGTIWCDVPSEARFRYWGDPTRTAEVWRAPSAEHLPNGARATGAFTVSDLGRLDDDGYLWLDGRRNDLIISGGVNVYPAEVEQALLGVVGVVDAAVFPTDDTRWGQRVCAAVVGDVDVEQLRVELRSRLAAYKCPKTVLVVDEVPRSSTGKVQRYRLATQLGLS
ncbi:MAG: AMP-binding protein [Acidimicrobiia bacterium]|nr:AMP-binding protein [Acidimicrobiia bacterium]